MARTFINFIVLVCLASVARAFDASKDKGYGILQTSGPTECNEQDTIRAMSEVTIHFTVEIDDSSAAGRPGKVVDSTRAEAGGSGVPLTIAIGMNQVLPGMDVGLVNLCKGAFVLLTLQPSMAYSEQGKEVVSRDEQGNPIRTGEYLVPPGTTLLVELEVIDVHEADVFKYIDLDADGKFDQEEVREYFQRQNWTEQVGALDDMWRRLDFDEDGFISWEEFDGPKGSAPPLTKDEL